jgi:hypothetical protein
MNQKVLNIIFGTVIIILVAAVAYFTLGKKAEQLSGQVDNNTQPTNVSNNWATYSNSSKGYSVEYPSNLIVNDDNLSQITIGSAVMPYVNITTYQLTANTDLQSFVQEKLINEFGGLLSASELKWVTIDNDLTKIGVKFSSKAGGYDGELYWVYIGHNNIVYKIAALTNYDNMTQSEFQSKIMSGFKFTK